MLHRHVLCRWSCFVDVSYIYIYIYIGSISSLIQISVNIIDILCLHIFFWIRSNSHITFIVFGGIIYVLSLVLCIPSTFCPTSGHHQGRIYYKKWCNFCFSILPLWTIHKSIPFEYDKSNTGIRTDPEEKYVDIKCLLCLMKFIYIYIYTYNNLRFANRLSVSKSILSTL